LIILPESFLWTNKNAEIEVKHLKSGRISSHQTCREQARAGNKKELRWRRVLETREKGA